MFISLNFSFLDIFLFLKNVCVMKYMYKYNSKNMTELQVHVTVHH